MYQTCFKFQPIKFLNLILHAKTCVNTCSHHRGTEKISMVTPTDEATATLVGKSFTGFYLFIYTWVRKRLDIHKY